MSDLFFSREKYGLINFQVLESSHKETVAFGTQTLSYKATQIWNFIAEKLRTLATLNKFKIEIKTWKCDVCPCRMCRTYIQHIRFIK